MPSLSPLDHSRRILLLAAGALAGAVVVVTAAWALDSHVHDGRVVRRVVVAGRQVGGMHRSALITWVDTVAGRYDTAPIEIRAPEAGFQSGASELGLSVDRAATVERVLSEGRRGNAASRALDWVVHLFATRRSAVVLHVDRSAVERVVRERDPKREPPTEPTLAVRDGHLVGVPGRPGRGIDAASVATGLARADLGGRQVVVSAGRGAVAPRFGREDAEHLASRAEALAESGFTLRAGPADVRVPPETMRRWLTAVPSDDGLQLGADAEAVAASFPKLFPAPVVAPVNAGFSVSGGAVSLVPAKPGSGCCGPEAAAIVAAALTAAPPPQPVVLPLHDIAPRRDEAAARKLGVVEQVATFTTPHKAGEPRVHNIHVIADTARGAVIEPGATFSLNGLVGPRTTAKGYVEAPVIGENSTFASSPGGGISQFTTTLFNAAFFAGLEIPEYQMHSLYISRYPFGREATISYPSPDLKLRNITPYGILIWPTYTDSSVTVSLYSTHFADASQSNQTTAPAGPCTVVTTERTRHFVDGRTAVDHFTGRYAPAEGVKCQ
jgi:vancomycin resistance protein YoaR